MGKYRKHASLWNPWFHWTWISGIFIVYTARVYCSVVCSIAFLADPVRRYERCVGASSASKREMQPEWNNQEGAFEWTIDIRAVLTSFLTGNTMVSGKMDQFSGHIYSNKKHTVLKCFIISMAAYLLLNTYSRGTSRGREQVKGAWELWNLGINYRKDTFLRWIRSPKDVYAWKQAWMLHELNSLGNSITSSSFIILHLL